MPGLHMSRRVRKFKGGNLGKGNHFLLHRPIDTEFVTALRIPTFPADLKQIAEDFFEFIRSLFGKHSHQTGDRSKTIGADVAGGSSGRQETAAKDQIKNNREGHADKRP